MLQRFSKGNEEMDTDRREFIQAGRRRGQPGYGRRVSAAAAQGNVAARAGGRKMIVRADDIGHSKVCNIGTFEAIENGVVTSADVMLDSPGTEDALERLKAYPWLSVGWHMHMWGAPVLDPKRVPSLIEKGGQFDGRFRTDLAKRHRCGIRRSGDGAPRPARPMHQDTGQGSGHRRRRQRHFPWGRAVRQVSDEFGLAYNFSSSPPTDAKYHEKDRRTPSRPARSGPNTIPPRPTPAAKADEKWASRKIIPAAGTNAYIDLLTDSISRVEKEYDPVLFYTEDRAGILKYPADLITWQAWHPGYVDYYTYRLGERVNRARAQQFVVGRTQDVAALCDVRLKNWIKQNRIELVNFRDALYGTSEYQNHLRVTGSDLAIA